MLKTGVLLGTAALALIAAGCTNGQSSQRATLSNGAQVVQVTPEIRADLRSQGLDPDEEVCKREEQMGSIIPARVCATRAMWAAQSKASQEYAAEIQRDALRTRAPGDGG